MHFVVQNPKSVPAPQRLGNSTKASTLKLPGYPTSHKLHFENSPLTLFPPSSSIPSTSRLAVLKAGGWLMGRPLATSKPRICAEAEHHRLLTLPRSHAGCLRSDLAGLELGPSLGLAWQARDPYEESRRKCQPVNEQIVTPRIKLHKCAADVSGAVCYCSRSAAAVRDRC